MRPGSKKFNTYVIGDIHGAYKALIQCFERAQFDYKKDHLIVLGDVCDGYPYVNKCVDELLKIKNCDLVVGNHDLWALDWALYDKKPPIWTNQGGDKTIVSYGGGPMPSAHIDFFKSGKPWYKQGKQVFVHGGFDPDIPLPKNNLQFLVWDRTLLDMACRRQFAADGYSFGNYEDIFVGHTTTELYNTLEPVHVCNVWDIDTGAGWSGKLTIMDVNTKRYWQSDLTTELYGATPDKL